MRVHVYILVEYTPYVEKVKKFIVLKKLEGINKDTCDHNTQNIIYCTTVKGRYDVVAQKQLNLNCTLQH
jgi:hypothetical protein